jgi:CBS domain-containing protein
MAKSTAHTDTPSSRVRRGRRVLGDLASNADLRMRAGTRLTSAWAVFLDRGLQSVTVVDEAGRPVGTLLRRDVADAVLDDAPTVPGVLLDEMTPPAEARIVGERLAWPRYFRQHDALVDDIMRGTVNTLPSSASIEDAAAVFEVAELSEVVVVDDRGSMIGLVAADDLIPYLAPRGSRLRTRHLGREGDRR